MSELVLELFSEEIPAKMQIKAAESILLAIENQFKTSNIEFSGSLFYVTPRRLFFYFNDISEEIPESIVEKKGPKVDAKEEAIEGFLSSMKMKKEDLVVIDNFYYAKKMEPAKPMSMALVAILEQVLISFTWPKSLRIGNDGDRSKWVRPLRNILCVFANQVLPIKFAGIKANNFTYGHRFMSPERIEIKGLSDYLAKMQEAKVVLDYKTRRNTISSRAQEIATELNLKVVLDPNLLDEVIGLVEYPNVLLGKIDQEFMTLPKEVLISVMKNHQRYFYLEDKQGQIAPYFIFVANVKLNDDAQIIAGNEKVLRARFADAKFFWEKDIKVPISENLSKLAKMTFHHKIGNMFDKVTRIGAIAEYIAAKINYDNIVSLRTAAVLSKTDLVSEMVGEFPELQGIMGEYYARNYGESQEIAKAVAEHYRPSDSNDIGDISLLGALIAISDKIDSIVCLWLANEKPTSSKDPFALRRAALGIIKLVKFHKLNLPLTELIQKVISESGVESNNNQQNEIFVFFQDRLKYFLKAEGFRHDLIMAVTNDNNDDIYSSIERVEALTNFIQKTEAVRLVFSIKRILKILSEVKNFNFENEIDVGLFKPAEHHLYETYLKTINIDKYEDLEVLIPAIENFFDQVLVNDSNEKLKANRLLLLNKIAVLSKRFADFSCIEV